MATGGGSEKTSVQVAIRIRPITNEDTTNLPTRFQRQILSASPPNQVIVQSEKKQSFSFDYVFGPEATQHDVYDKAIVKLVENFLEGYNVTILAYGQTSSGKTHTMGTADNTSIPPESKGIIPRAMQTLFSSMNAPHYKSRKFSLKVSFIEIYNEDLIDLLGESYGDSRPQVTIREDTKGNILWSGLQEIRVNSVNEVMGHLTRGSANRQVGATDMNAQSSRSHAIFSVTMIQQKFVGSSTAQAPARPGTPSKMLEPKFGIRSQSSTNNLRMSRRIDEGEFVSVTSKFHFVDLAGSERLKRTSAVGERAKEGISINSGLLALGNVISALGDPNKAKHTTHIPYRDSKLTRLLQDSLGGNAQTLMIACVSPAEYNLSETVNTLKYANRARNIKNSATVNQEEVGWHDLEHLQNLVLKLRTEIRNLKSTNPSNSNAQSGSNNSSGRNTPSLLTPPSNDTSPHSRLARPKSPHINNPTNEHKDVEVLEDQLRQIQRSYAELTQKHAKTSAELAAHQDNFDHDGVAKTNNIDKIFPQKLREEKENFMEHASASFQEAVEPVIEEYEKSISSLESQLALTRAALNHTETIMDDQEAKLDHAEHLNEQNKNLIFDLRNKIEHLREREETAEHYIKDLESKLEVHSEEQSKDQELINELKSEISQLKSNGSNSEGYIQNLESRLASSEEQTVKFDQMVERLEKRLQQRELAYSELEEKMRQSNIDDEKKMLLGAIDERDRRIIQLEQKVNELLIELEKLRLKSQERELNNLQGTHQRSTSIASVISEDEKSVTYSPIAKGLSLKDEQDRLLVADLEAKLSKLQQTHEQTVVEFTEIKVKYQTCLNEISELQTQLNEARMMESEYDEFRCTTPSTPITPMSPQSDFGPPNPLRMSLPPPLRIEVSGKSPYDNGLTTAERREFHRKSKSLSGDIRGSERRDLAHLAIAQRLQMEIKQLESLNEDKATGLDAVKKEFARLEMSHRATLEIVEELREEIKRRDALAQLEVMSVMATEVSDRSDSTSVTELDELEIVIRLREEVENLKEQQSQAIGKISELEKENNNKSEDILQIESKIQSLRDQMYQTYNEKSIDVALDNNAIEENIIKLQMKIKELEAQLVEVQENQRFENVTDTVSKLEGKNDELYEHVKNEMKTLRMRVEKLQVEIEAKSHTIAALVLPNEDRLCTIKRLENELQEVKQAYRFAIDDKSVSISEAVVVDSDTSDNVNSSDKLEQNVDKNVNVLEERVKELELKLSKLKEINSLPTSRSSALHIVDPTQKSVEALQAKLIILQEELANKSDNIENLKSEKDLVIALQSHLETLKSDLKRKYELIEVLKRDLVVKGVLQQKLREKEAEALMLKAQLSEVKVREEDMQKQMLQVQIQLQKVESSKGADQILQSEIENVKKELREVKERETSALERLQTLNEEESKLKQELKRYKTVEITQRERINVLETQLSEQDGNDGNLDEDIIKLKTELNLVKESEAEYKLKIAILETKLERSENDFAALRNKIDLLKSKTIGQSTQIQNHELQLNEVRSAATFIDSQQVSLFNKEIEILREQDAMQRKKIDTLENRLKQLQQDTTVSALKIEINELKNAESNLKHTIKELENKLETAQKESDESQVLKNEISLLKKSESEQNISIEQLQSQIKVITGEKDGLIRELESLRKEYNAQKEFIISLEKELNDVREELSKTKEADAVSSIKLDNLSKLLADKERQRDEELKKIKTLENQIQAFKDVESVVDKDANSLKDALTNAKLEIGTQNGLINEYEVKVKTLEKERDQHANRVTELTKTLETKEIEQKKIVATLKSSKSNLESQLVEAKSSSQFDQNTITSLGNKLASVGTLFGEAKASEERHIKKAREVDEKLREANTTLLIKERMLTTKDAFISELEVTLHNTREDLENAKISASSESRHVKQLQARIYDLETELLKRPSSSELEAVKKTAAKQSDLVKELEMKLASLERKSPTDVTTSIGAIALMSAQLEEAKHAEIIQINALKDKQENLKRLQEMMDRVNAELEIVKKSEAKHVELIKTLETQLKAAEGNHNAESSRLDDANAEIEFLKSRCKKLQNELDDTQKATMIKNYSDVDHSEIVEELTNQLKEAHNEAKVYRDQVEELEKITKQLETDKQNQINTSDDLKQQIEHLRNDFDSIAEGCTETATKYEDVVEISKEQKIRITELEKALEETQNQKRTLSSHKSNDSLIDGFDTYDISSDSTLSKLAAANENLRQINDNLHAKVTAAEDHVVSLKHNIRDLEKELGHLNNALKGATVEELKEKITELEAEKEGLEQANKSFGEDRKKLDQKIESLMKQLNLAGRGGNKTAAQLVELNNKLIALEHEYANLKQQTLIDAQEMEDEITRLLNINELLEKEINELESQIPKRNSGASFDSKNLTPIIPKLNVVNDSVKTKLQRQDNTISQQNNLIKVLQDKICELERKIETENVRRRPSFGAVSITDHDGPGPTGVRLSTLSIMSASSTKSILDSRNDFIDGSNTPTGDLAMEIQKLHRKIAKIEGENIQSKRLVETLENSLDENETNLRVAKQQLHVLQKEKAELVEQIKTLRSSLDETTEQFEHARSSVYEEKKVIETVLEEERKAKENAEKARRQLESRMEELMAKKSKFMCF
ncbi:17640_t:CDS:2 [Funneliformis geosporum]|uniref:15631_t:CDS:1 n=1 Tax=Funneliformis geosporum TaxID=1117311 RepID=A0A9W4WPA6_9GLOM|nr:15631_t:CDS:2 [Funneliformis geosporum]CAI2161836.1 17640_t:CDS:2 [Funneliformis geosporum]